MASKGINKVILVGNLGQDPVMRVFRNGESVANITIATSEAWKDRNTGEQREKTEWHKVTMFRKLAEIAGKHLKKGSKVYIEGSLQTRKWQDQSGQDRYTTEVNASNMQMLGGVTTDNSFDNTPINNQVIGVQGVTNKPQNNLPSKANITTNTNSQPFGNNQNTNVIDDFDDIPF